MASLKQIRQLKRIYEKKIQVELERKIEELDEKEHQELNLYYERHFKTVKNRLKPEDFDVSIFRNEVYFRAKTDKAKKILEELCVERSKIREKYDKMKDQLFDRHRELLNELEDWEIRQSERILLKEDIEPFEIKW